MTAAYYDLEDGDFIKVEITEVVPQTILFISLMRIFLSKMLTCKERLVV
jgi:hypothetical protein